MSHRYDFAPLEAFVRAKLRPVDRGERYPLICDRDVMTAMGLDYRTFFVYRQQGLIDTKADWLAIRVGVHPAVIWPEWFAIAATRIRHRPNQGRSTRRNAA